MPGRKDTVPLTPGQRDLAEQYQWMAEKKIVGFPTAIPIRDAMQIARLAVCLAAQDYDASLGIKFETYAYSKIDYLLLDALKKLPLINISPHKGKRDEAKAVRAYRVARLYTRGPRSMMDYTDKEANESSLWAKPVDLGDELDRKEWHERFHRLLARLPERSRTVIRMKLAGCNDAQCGRAIGLCQSGASKVARTALREIGSQMGMQMSKKRRSVPTSS